MLLPSLTAVNSSAGREIAVAVASVDIAVVCHPDTVVLAADIPEFLHRDIAAVVFGAAADTLYPGTVALVVVEVAFAADIVESHHHHRDTSAFHHPDT